MSVPPPPPAAPKPRRKLGPASREAGAPSRRRLAAPPRAPQEAPLRLLALVALLTLAADQALKWLVVRHLNLAELHEIDVWEPWLNLRMAWNEGVNFGLFANSAGAMRWILIAVAVAVCAWIIVWVQRSRPARVARIAAGLLVGGAIGNAIDRVTWGAVADFLNMSLPGWRNPYSFNLADIAIFAGAIGLVLWPAEKPRDGAPPAR